MGNTLHSAAPLTTVSGDVPADVQDVLAQLHAAAVGAVTERGPTHRQDPAASTDAPPADADDSPLPARDADTTPEAEFTAAVETAQTVAHNKLPAGPLRDRLTHGYDRALATVDGEATVAAEYVRAADRRLAAATDGDATVDGRPSEASDGDERDDGDDPSEQ